MYMGNRTVKKKCYHKTTLLENIFYICSIEHRDLYSTPKDILC